MIKDIAAFEARERAAEEERRVRWAKAGSVREAEALLTSDLMRFARPDETRPRCAALLLGVRRHAHLRP